MTHLLGVGHRVAVSDGWIKWQTPDDWPSEETTGFHADQSVVPAPWNLAAAAYCQHELDANRVL